MSEFEKLKIVTKYELLKQFRRKRFYGALVLTLLAVILVIALYKGLDIPGKLPISDSPELFALFVTSAGATIPIFAAVFFAGDSIASEFEHKTGYILFPNPVKRSTLVIGKYIACLAVTALIVILAYVATMIALVGIYQQLPIEVFGALVLALVYANSVLGIAFLYSSVLKGSMGATIATLLTIMLVFGVIEVSLIFANIEPWFMHGYAGDSIASVYGISFAAFGGMMPGGGMERNPDPITSFFVMLGYFIVPFILSIWLVKRREMF